MYNLKVIFLLFYLTTLFFSVTGITANRIRNKAIETLPEETDLDFYLKSLEKVVNFYTRHKHNMDLILAFGCCMVDVNFRSHLLNKLHYDIPVKTRSRLKTLLFKVNALIEYFKDTVQNMKDSNGTEYVVKTSQDLKYMAQFYDKKKWSTPEKFNTDLLKRTPFYSREKLVNIYGKWEDFKKNLDKRQNTAPSRIWDECWNEMLVARSNSTASPSSPPAYCSIHSRCKTLVTKVSDDEDSWISTLYYLIMARFKRRCIVLSETDDKNLTDIYCLKIFSQSQYIALYNYQLPDRLNENIVLCGILGHAQFLEKLWLRRITRFQTSEGCFSNLLAIRTGEFENPQTRRWDFTQLNKITNGMCDSKFTANSMAALSNGLRYIIETNYYGYLSYWTLWA